MPDCLTKKCPDCKEDWEPYGSPKFGVKCNLCGRESSLSWFSEMNDLGWPQKPIKMKEWPKPECAARHIQDIRLLCSWLGLMPDKSLEDCKAQILKRAETTESLRKELRSLRESATNEAFGEMLREWMGKVEPYKGLAEQNKELKEKLEEVTLELESAEEILDFKDRYR